MKRKKKEKTKEDKPTNVELKIKELEKKHGEGIIMRLNKNYKQDVKIIPTGSLNLDFALGVGGLVRGRVIEIYGNEASGKTTLVLSLIKQTQKLGGKVVFIDAEHSLDYDYAKKIGIKIDEVIFSQPDYGEQALDVVQSFVESGGVDLIIIDSVDAITPKAVIDGEIEDKFVGQKARLMSQGLRQLVVKIGKTNTCVVFTNQIREKIGVRFGNPETTPGGRALKFYASMRIELRKGKNIEKDDKILGTNLTATVRKNKVAPPFKKVDLRIYCDEGLSESADILLIAIKHSIVKKSEKGGWYNYKDENIGQGFNNARLELKKNPKLMNEIKQKILELLGKKEELMYPPEIKAEISQIAQDFENAQVESLDRVDKPKKKRGRKKKVKNDKK